MEKIVIGLVGESGSGKDTVADYLSEKYGANLMRFADPLRDTLLMYLEHISREDLQWLSTGLRKRFGQDILCKALIKKIKDNDDKIIVLNGMRVVEDLNFVKNFTKNFVIYVTASQDLRWKRTFNRGEKKDDNAEFEKFKEMEKAETEIQIPELGKKADFVVRNEKDLEYLKKSVDQIMAKILC